MVNDFCIPCKQIKFTILSQFSQYLWPTNRAICKILWTVLSPTVPRPPMESIFVDFNLIPLTVNSYHPQLLACLGISSTFSRNMKLNRPILELKVNLTSFETTKLTFQRGPWCSRALVYKVGVSTINGSDAQVRGKQSSKLKFCLSFPSWRSY